MDETTEKAIKALRRDLSKRASVPNGTVVRVSIAGRYGTVLTYAAVWVTETQLWYPTGNKAPMAHQQFLDWVGAAQTVEAAIEWEVL